MTDRTRLIIGTMTGTSIDAIDAALVQITGSKLDIKAQLIDTRSQPLGRLAQRLRDLANGSPAVPRTILQLNNDLSDLHAQLVSDLGAGRAIEFITVHGQTIFHDPPLSWQLINPARIACQTGITILSDLRAADLAAGGQGAPITPLADAILFSDPELTTAVVNLGGFCNITILPPTSNHMDTIDRIAGFDCCACNHMLNALAISTLNAPFDRDGAAALGGSSDPKCTAYLANAMSNQRAQNRSLGTGDELDDVLAALPQPSPPAADLLRSACHAIALTITNAIAPLVPSRIILAGGSALNAALVHEIRTQNKNIDVLTTDKFNIPVSHRESVAMAVLGALCHDRIPITLEQVTRVPPPAPVAGTWTHP